MTRDRGAGGRRAHLARVEAILQALPVEAVVSYRALETSGKGSTYDWSPPPGTPGLVVAPPPGRASVNGLAQVASATVLDESDSFDAWGGPLTRTRSLAFDTIPGPGRLVYVLFFLEDSWEARGHGRWSPPARVRHSGDPASIAAELATWAGHAPAEPEPAVPDADARAAQLRRQLEARRAGVPVVAEVGPDDLEEAAEAAPAVLKDLAHVSHRLLAWHFPRDARGRLLVRGRVALSCYRGRGPRGPQLWLVAEGPAGAREAPGIHLRLRWEHGANQDHRWDGDRWLWDARCQKARLAARWGVADHARADRSAALLDAGRFREGLGLFGVELSPEAEAVVGGRMPWHALDDLAGRWCAVLRAQLAWVAPWRLAAAHGPATAARPLRLFGLGGQNIVRKPGLFLGGAPGRPRLEIHWSASNARLPLVAWRRPADYDLVRLGLIDQGELEGLPS